MINFLAKFKVRALANRHLRVCISSTMSDASVQSISTLAGRTNLPSECASDVAKRGQTNTITAATTQVDVQQSSATQASKSSIDHHNAEATSNIADGYKTAAPLCSRALGILAKMVREGLLRAGDLEEADLIQLASGPVSQAVDVIESEVAGKCRAHNITGLYGLKLNTVADKTGSLRMLMKQVVDKGELPKVKALL